MLQVAAACNTAYLHTGCNLSHCLYCAEGVSYLVIVGIVAWSLFTKVQTGRGLPSGPGGLLGAAEGFSYLSLVAGIIVAGLTIAEKGSLPGITG